MERLRQKREPAAIGVEYGTMRQPQPLQDKLTGSPKHPQPVPDAPAEVDARRFRLVEGRTTDLPDTVAKENRLGQNLVVEDEIVAVLS